MKMKRLSNSNYVNFNNVNMIKKEKGIYNILIKRKIKVEKIQALLNFERETDEVPFFKNLGLFKVQDYYINIENLVYVNILKRENEKVHVEFIFNTMSYDTVIDSKFFDHWESHYL